MKKAIGFVIGLVMICLGVCQIASVFVKPELKEQKVLEQSDNIFIGDVTTDDSGVEFKVESVENVKKVGSGFYEITTENNFVVVQLSITNNNNEPYTLNALNFLLTSNGNEYTHDNRVLLLNDDKYLYLGELNPGLSETYAIVYETPTDTNTEEYKLKIKENSLRKYDNRYITLKTK